MIDLDELIISEEALANLQDEELVLQYLEEGKPLQELFGFTDDVTAEFYEAAKNILEQNRFEEAADAFLFLTTINPYISDFWMGLGMAQQQNNDHDDALFSYSVAFTLDGRVIFPYVLAAQCCMDTKDFDKAIEILDFAELYVKEHPEEEECKQLKDDAVAAKQYVLEQQRKAA